MQPTDQYGNTADTLAAIYGGSASDYADQMVNNVPASAAGTGQASPSAGTSIWGNAFSSIPTLLSSGITAYTAVNNAGAQQAAAALAARNAAAANAIAGAKAQSSINLSTALPWVIGLVAVAAILFGGLAIFKKK